MATTRFDHARLPDAVAYFEKIFGRLRFNGAGWAQVSCPFHAHDREPSLSLHRDGGFNCFACGAHGGDIIEFEHLRTGRDRRAIAQGWGAWSGRPIFERPRPAWARPAPRPVIVKDRAEKPKLTAEYFEAARLNFEAIKAEAHALCDRGFSVHALDGKIPRGTGWPERAAQDPRRHRAAFPAALVRRRLSPIPISDSASTWSLPATRPIA